MKKTIITAMLIILTLTGCEENPNNNKDTELQQCINHYLYYQDLIVYFSSRSGGDYETRNKKERQYNSWTGKQKCCWKNAQNTLRKLHDPHSTPPVSCNENNPPEFINAASIEANKTYVKMLNLFK